MMLPAQAFVTGLTATSMASPFMPIGGQIRFMERRGRSQNSTAIPVARAEILSDIPLVEATIITGNPEGSRSPGSLLSLAFRMFSLWAPSDMVNAVAVQGGDNQRIIFAERISSENNTRSL